jgi:phosphatidate cytidylyltransferase
VLKLRLLTIAVLLPAFAAAAFYLPGVWWSAILFAALLIAAGEWSGLAGFGRGMSALFYFILGVGCALVWTHGDWDNRIYAASIVFWSMAVPLALRRKPELRGSIVLAVAGFFVLVPMWLALVRLQSDPALLLALLAIVWISDAAAYGAGRAWGRHKLAPSISPGKTWEGVGGAFAAVAVYAAAFHFCWLPAMDFGFVLAAFFAIAALGIVGDLFESLLKRGAGVKDSGRLLPGHGGVLDRIDAMTAALPLAALLFARP